MTRALATWGVTILLCMFLSVVLGAVWWGLWMNHGWPGATGLLAKVLGAQGDAYYDAMQDEMTLWSFGLLLALSRLTLRLWRGRSKV